MKTRTVWACDFGILPGESEDCSARLQAMLDSLEYSEDEAISVQLKRGEYRVYRPVRIRGAKNLVVRGGGSTIVAHFSPSAPISLNNDVFVLEQCDDIEFHDLFFDTDNPIGAAGRITAINREKRTADLKIYDEFAVTGFEHYCATNSFDEKGSPDYALATYHNTPTEREYIFPDGERSRYLVGLPYDVIGDHLVRLRLDKDYPRLRVGHEINIRYEMYGNSIFTFTFCRRVLMKNIIIHSAASFGVTIRPRCEDFVFDNFCIRVPKHSRRLKAANADGIHALGLAGKLVLRNCNMEGMGDDTLNIHGQAGGITAIDRERRTVSMVYPYRGQILSLPKSWAIPGDRIYVYDSDSFAFKGSFVIDTVDAEHNATYRDEIGEFGVGDTLANSEYFASLHIDGCVVRNTRARGFLVQTHNVLIENSYIYGMSLAALLFAPDIRVWWEVGPCKNVEIRNNVIEYCAHIKSKANQGAVIFKACHDGSTADYPAGVHEDIYIHDNRFIDIAQSAIYISSAKNLRIEGNRFTNCCYDPQDDSEWARYDIVAVNCKNVVIRDNASDRGDDTLQCLLNCE